MAGKLPMNPNDESLFTVISDGVILCKLVNRIKGGIVTESKIALKPKNQFESTNNINLALEAARMLGCSIVNIGAKDIASGTPHLILGVLWQVEM